MLTKFGAQVVLDPDKARAQLRRVLKAHHWSSYEAALELGANAATVKRWINKLGLRAEVEAERVKLGLPKRGGRNRTQRRAN